jgi:putative transposase
VDQKAKEEIALFRYALIRPLVDEGLSAAEFSARLGQVASRSHQRPKGEWRRISRRTILRWIDAYRNGGFFGLAPKDRCDTGTARAIEGDVLDLAETLKREAPRRSSAQIAEIIARKTGTVLSERTLRRHLARRGATYAELVGTDRRVYTRFERERPNEMWIGDGLHGPKVTGRKTHLFAFIDDHSRLIPHGEFFFDESLPRLERTLKVAIEKRGLPGAIYVDNGAVFVSHQFDRICAHLGIRRILATPGEPAGRGKIERFFRTVRSQFLVEVATEGVASLAELNASFIAWTEVVYHHRHHSETQETPAQRFDAGLVRREVDPAVLAEAFRWEEERNVAKTATVSISGNRYEVNGHLVGKKVSLRFDPFDMSAIEVFFRGESFGLARAHVLKHSAHPAARKAAEEPAAPASGIDYLAALRAEHEASLRREIPYRDLDDDEEEEDDV